MTKFNSFYFVSLFVASAQDILSSVVVKFVEHLDALAAEYGWGHPYIVAANGWFSNANGSDLANLAHALRNGGENDGITFTKTPRQYNIEGHGATMSVVKYGFSGQIVDRIYL